jgi:branched-chain amino acid transport system permease protein
MKRWVLLAVVLLGAPLALPGPFYERMAALVLLSAISASSWNLVGGYALQISIGHAVFFGVGAYTPLVFYQHWGFAPVVGIPVAVLISLAVALLVGTPTFRLQGHYFAMATIAVAELVRIVVTNWDFVGGAVGQMGPATPRTIWDFTFRSSLPYYYLFLAVLVVLLGITYWISRGRMGYYLRAIGAHERAARSLGVPVRRYKLYAFMLSAGFTTLAGSLYALMVGFIDPTSGFGILVSVEMVITAALGGAGTLLGPLLGAVILVPLEVMTNSLFGGGGTGLTYIVYGGVIILLSVFEPGGLLEIGRRVQTRFKRRPEPAEVARAA